MKHSRDLMDIENVGEFAFVMSVIGALLALVAFVVAMFLTHWVGIGKRSQVIVLTAALWVALNVPVYRSLRRRARRWIGEQRATKQVVYLEICSMTMLAGLSLLAGEATGARELIVSLRYLFSFWILALLGYQVLIHFALGYRILRRDAVRWCLVGGFALYSLYAESSQP